MTGVQTCALPIFVNPGNIDGRVYYRELFASGELAGVGSSLLGGTGLYYGANGITGARDKPLTWKPDGSGFTVGFGPGSGPKFTLQNPLTFDITTEDATYGRGMYLTFNAPNCGTVKYYRWDNPNAYRAIK